MSALLLQTVLLVFMCHGDSVFHWFELCRRSMLIAPYIFGRTCLQIIQAYIY